MAEGNPKSEVCLSTINQPQNHHFRVFRHLSAHQRRRESYIFESFLYVNNLLLTHKRNDVRLACQKSQSMSLT